MSRNRKLTIALILGVVFIGALLLGLQGSAAQAQVTSLPAMPQPAGALPATTIKEAAATQTFTPAWATERVDAEKTFGSMTDRSLALDSANRPHIAYGTDHLYYAWHDGSTWNIETVDPAWGVGRYASAGQLRPSSHQLLLAHMAQSASAEICFLDRQRLGHADGAQWVRRRPIYVTCVRQQRPPAHQLSRRRQHRPDVCSLDGQHLDYGNSRRYGGLGKRVYFDRAGRFRESSRCLHQLHERQTDVCPLDR